MYIGLWTLFDPFSSPAYATTVNAPVIGVSRFNTED